MYMFAQEKKLTSSVAQFSKLAKRLKMSGLGSKVYCLQKRENDKI